MITCLWCINTLITHAVEQQVAEVIYVSESPHVQYNTTVSNRTPAKNKFHTVK